MSKRQWQAKQILSSVEFDATSKVIKRLLAGLDYCLIGGLAVGHYVNPPVTVDVDVLVDADQDALDRIAANTNTLWHSLVFHSQLKGLPRYGVAISHKDGEIDLISTGSDEYLVRVVKNSKAVLVAPKVKMPVISAEDLVVMKTLVGRDKDSDDVDELRFKVKNLNTEYIEKQLEELQ